MKKGFYLCLIILFSLNACSVQNSAPKYTDSKTPTAFKETLTDTSDPGTFMSITEKEDPSKNPEPKMLLEFKRKEHLSFSELSAGGTPVSSQVLEDLNLFFQSLMAGHFLLSNYNSPGELDFYYLLHDGCPIPDETNQYHGPESLTDEEMRILTNNFKRWTEKPDFVEGYKMTASDIDEMLLYYTGYSLDETKKYGMDWYNYLSDYDSYYQMRADNIYNTFQIVNAVEMTDGSFLAHWIAEDGLAYRKGDCGAVRLSRVGGDWKIKSNTIIQQDGIGKGGFPFLCFFSGTYSESLKEDVFRIIEAVMKTNGSDDISEYSWNYYDPLLEPIWENDMISLVYPKFVIGYEKISDPLKQLFEQYWIEKNANCTEIPFAVVFIPDRYKEQVMKEIMSLPR